MHENAHNQGAVQYSSPQSTGSGGHCSQGHDVLCYAPDGGDRNQVLSIACADRVHFDCEGDDYFDPSPEPGEYLATHWNLGSPLNRFIVFSDASAPAAPEPAAAEPACVAASCAARLRLGADVHGVVGAQGEAPLYRLNLPKGRRRLEVSIEGQGPISLAIRHGVPPDSRRSDCASVRAGSRQSCRIPSPRRGYWYVSVTGADAAEFELRAEAAAGSRRR